MAGDPGKAGDPGTAGDPGAKGDPGDPGKAGDPGKDVDPAVLADIQAKLDAAKNVTVEQCSICHAGAGAKKHQDVYNQYRDASALILSYQSISAVAGTTTGTFDTTITVKITKNGLPYEDIDGLPSLEQKRFYSVQYDAATRMHTGSNAFGTIKAVAGQPGFYTVNDNNVPYDMTASSFNGLFYGYIADDVLETEGMTLYNSVSNMAKAFGTAVTTPYVSLANISGCEKCHGKPYMKHGYRAATAGDGTGGANLGDFVACKACHYDDRSGSHRDWQLLVDDPAKYADYDTKAKAAAAAGDTTKNSITKQMTQAELDKYAYTATVMNDTHMSHAMEFPYPMKMSNCTTCHEGKLTEVLDDKYFTKATCKSCHAWTGSATYGTAEMAMESIWTRKNVGFHTTNTAECNTCHKLGGNTQLKDMHNGGFDAKIYTQNGANRYADVFKAKIGTTTYDATTNKLTIELSTEEVGGAATVAGYDAADVVPTVMVGLYGYNTKDFIVNAHGRDENVGTCTPACTSSQVCDATNKCITRERLLEFVLDGSTNKRLTVVTSTPPNWKIEVDLSMWKQMLTDKVIKRAEIGIMPALTKVVNDKDEDVGTCTPACTSGNHCNASNACVPNDDFVVGLDAPSRTFDLTKNAFDDTFYKDITDVKKCNACHDQLATSFHSGNRGGSIRVCRLCHVASSGGSHLEMQSRSIDSYVHAIHSFQAFDPGDIDFTDPVEKIRYEHHVEHKFPNFTIKNCEACHNPGTYVDPPDASQSLAGILSGSDKVDGRNIGTVKAVVTGPGARACGACHRSQMINEDKAGKLSAFYQHMKSNGYVVEDGAGILDTVIKTIMEQL